MLKQSGKLTTFFFYLATYSLISKSRLSSVGLGLYIHQCCDVVSGISMKYC